MLAFAHTMFAPSMALALVLIGFSISLSGRRLAFAGAGGGLGGRGRRRRLGGASIWQPRTWSMTRAWEAWLSKVFYFMSIPNNQAREELCVRFRPS